MGLRCLKVFYQILSILPLSFNQPLTATQTLYPPFCPPFCHYFWIQRIPSFGSRFRWCFPWWPPWWRSWSWRWWRRWGHRRGWWAPGCCTSFGKAPGTATVATVATRATLSTGRMRFFRFDSWCFEGWCVMGWDVTNSICVPKFWNFNLIY